MPPVDGAVIGDRLRGLVGPSPAVGSLIEQLHDSMDDAEYAAIAVAIVKLRTKEGGPP